MDLEQFEQFCETFDNPGATIAGLLIAGGAGAAFVWLEFPVWALILLIFFGAFMVWPKRVYAFITVVSEILPSLKR